MCSSLREDHQAFRRAFDERFDKVVDGRRSRNAQLRQMLVEPSFMSSTIRARSRRPSTPWVPHNSGRVPRRRPLSGVEEVERRASKLHPTLHIHRTWDTSSPSARIGEDSSDAVRVAGGAR
jgi:hypothetical protein